MEAEKSAVLSNSWVPALVLKHTQRHVSSLPIPSDGVMSGSLIKILNKVAGLLCEIWK